MPCTVHEDNSKLAITVIFISTAARKLAELIYGRKKATTRLCVSMSDGRLIASDGADAFSATSSREVRTLDDVIVEQK